MARLLERFACAAIALSMLTVVVSMPDSVDAGMPHDPILISGDGGFTFANGVTQGDGTEANPYVIEGWIIDSPSVAGIKVKDTTAFFEIRGVTVKGGYQGSCILISNALHVVIDGATVEGASWGVRLESCTAAVVKNIVARGCSAGIELLWCDSCVLQGNNLEYSWIEIYDAVNAILYSNALKNAGVSIIGDLWNDETYNSHVIPSNNTVNGLPLLCYSFQDGLTLNKLSAGQLIILSCTNVQISGLSFDRSFMGIQIALSENVEVTNCRFVHSGSLGCMSCTNVSVTNNECTESSLGFFQCTNVLVDSNVITESYYMGIQLHNCWYVTASSNTIVGADLYYGIYTNSDHVTLTGNSLTGCGIDGSLRAGNDLKITPDNTVNGKPVLFYQGQTGVVVDSVPVGQLLVGSCDDVWVGNISVSNTHCGITAEDISGLTIFNTVLTGNSFGMSVYDVSSLQVLYNRFEGNLYYGAQIQYTTDSTVYSNLFKDNELGLQLWMSDVVRVYHNIFSGNIEQAAADGCSGVEWDGGYPEGGNFWSDYIGVDEYSGPCRDIPGADGFGDTSYVAGGVMDHYPFMTPPDISIPEPPPTGIDATINIEPDALNLRRMGAWITVYIDLPSGYDVADIVLESIVLNGHVPATGPWEIGDFDHDKVAELMVKFDWRKGLRLEEGAAGESMNLTVSGVLKNGVAFQGSDVIMIVPSSGDGSAQTYTGGVAVIADVLGLAAIFPIVLLGWLVVSRRR